MAKKVKAKSGPSQKMEKKIEKKIEKGMKDCCTDKKNHKSCGTGGCFYFMAFVGAAVYYLSTAQTFWGGLWGIVKALLWPAFLVFEIMKYIGM